ncbi:MAG: UDP-2,4-diacetamido-2,4,6-trideoxy-beta-L-altropyranose hydrolase [Gammaproteobacteria bacterium]|nr:UDP-2,4-diacetamido-2,4,6-trideoxy-beta-L-altropyranose hydrolase [Gammaproteobacteria bacterium]
MRALIRTDASLHIGSGHVMRCLCLARALAAHAVEVQFACRELPGHMIGAIRARGFRVHRLESPRAARDGDSTAEPAPVDQAQDAAATRTLLEALGGVDLLVVDHYALDLDWERALRALAGRIAAIDDLPERAHDADILLDQNLGAEERDGGIRRLAPGCARLLGPRYALLRPEFAAARAVLRRRDGHLRRLFVFLGGTDPGGYTLKVLDALTLRNPPPLTDVVVGAGNPQADIIATRCRGDARLRFCQDVDDVAERMVAADFAVGAGGTATWERACVGLPSLILTVAGNQRAGAGAMAAAGAAIVMAGESASADAIAAQLDALTPQRLQAMSARCLEQVDGRGTERVLRILLPPPIVLRRAAPADRDAMLAWRNDPGVRRYSHDGDPIPAAAHARWFAAALADPARLLLVAEHADRPVGVLRYDCDGQAAHVSIYLVPGCSGRGYGPAMLRAGSRWLSSHRPDLRRITAQVLANNDVSRQAFAAAGYTRGAGSYEQVLNP